MLDMPPLKMRNSVTLLRARLLITSTRDTPTACQRKSAPTRNDLRSCYILSRRILWIVTLLLVTAGVGNSMAAPAQAVIPACDPITVDTTWTTGNVYVVQNCALIVQAGATLTIQPGVIVKFGAPNASGLRVDGRLIAQGTAVQPIVFTSLADDSAGGDTNGNGASSGASGDWYGLVLTSNSQTTLDHVIVRYAGGYLINGALDGWSDAQIEVKEGAQFSLTHSEVRAGGRMGIYLNGIGLTPTIQSVHIADHTNTENQYRFALYQYNINMQPSYSDVTFSGNTRNEVTIGRFNEPLTQDVTLGGANFGFDCGYTLCLNTVPTGRTLTVAPGTQLDFRASFGIAIANGGSLIAEGTATQPITFTSRLAEAGDPNQYWIGLWAQAGSRLRLAHCGIGYADDGNFGNGGLEIDSDDAQVQNCKIHHNRATGLYLLAPSNGIAHAVLNNVDVTDNGGAGVHLESRFGAVLSAVWEGGAISRNGWSGVTAYTSNSIISPTLRSLTIANNGARGDYPERRAGIYWDYHNISPLLTDLTLTGNAGTAVYWYCNGSITARNLTATGNGANELTVPGCDVSGGRQWDLGDAGIPTRVTGDINVTPNALLSLAPGTTLRFDKNQYNSPTRLQVQDQASLYALGTAQKPIVFTGNTQTPGWWEGISARQRATLTLRHCEVGYGGASTSSLLVSWGWPNTGVPVADIQNCEIHHSSRKGVHFDFANYSPVTSPPIFHYNNLHDNAEEAVANRNAPVLDARDNYWGDPTGPFHATQNPGGLGDNVGDNILFYPWLAAPGGGAAAGKMQISTGAPRQISPGETVDYALQYLNEMTITVQSSILMLQLPQAAYFLEGTAGAVYWPDRHQVFWKLGDLPPNANGFVSARVKFQWGLPADYSDGSYTQFAGTNYNTAALDVAGYNAYQTSAPRVTRIVELSESEFAAVRATSADLESLYQMALREGFQYLSAARITYADGKEAVNGALRTADRQYGRILSLGESRALASTVGGGMVAVRDMTGGITATLSTQSYEFWGSWAPVGSVAAADEGDREGASPGGADCGEARCFANCMLKAKAWGAVARKVAAAVSWVIPPFGAAWTTYEIYDEITTYLECRDDCRMTGTRSNHCCTPGDVRWSPTGLKQQCAQYSCDAVGTWKQTPDKIDKCAFGERCVANEGTAGGCKACEEELIAAQFVPVVRRADAGLCAAAANPRCSDLTVRQAKDPNAIYGLDGDLLPGQVVTYTITYENEGAGTAYGVYVVNQLPAVFDADTLAFVNQAGTYLPQSSEIVWLVGELAPKNQAGSTGIITYTVALTGGLPSGTVVANQAVVFFPSVPEETPTNTWVNLVTPLVATPQRLTTAYLTPLPITLSGREVSGLPLTYQIVEPPHGGTLTGAAPNLTYTPAANFTGPDAFTFRVSNGASTSRPAQVTIEVTPQGDTTPPQVLWTNPADGTGGIAPSAAPVFTDTLGPVYTPVILIGVSEALDTTTVHSGAVTLTRSGAAVAASVAFDGGVNQIVLHPRAALGAGEYRVTVTTGVKDAAGNALAAAHVTTFTIGEEHGNLYLPLVTR